ncbi:MAG TPA: class I SAM-dependent methyltransferase [candidate division Zixibacteria bacterium]|nr:class I SAM-dependent methyltransferase [candidate division Zixibacteria bacterium]
MSDVLSRFVKNPIGFIKRVIYKKFIGPRKYGSGNDYDAARYWEDRLAKYGDSLRGVGDEGKSDRENVEEYARDEKIFCDVCNGLGVNFEKASVLDIGCGTGFYTDILERQGVKDYTGVDITNHHFEKLRERFPDYSFIKKDITSEKHEGDYDLIIMIEVLEHIVNDDKLDFAMENVKRCLKENGVFLISSIWEKGRKHMFYVRKWTLDEIRKRFRDYHFSEPIPFRGSYMVAIRKSQQSDKSFINNK